ncbi:hypothetical protein ACFL0Q_00615 [Thermodesulfobacteriota bacterium]
MNLLSKLFRRKGLRFEKPNGTIKTAGELIAEVTGGANLVEGKQTWEYAKDKKHNIDYMKKCCDAELKTMKKTGLEPAPYYFLRVAILSRKEKNYQQEIDYCERYINAVEQWRRKHSASHIPVASYAYSFKRTCSGHFEVG